MMSINNKSQIKKFLYIGVFNTIFGVILMFVLFNLFGLSYWIASSINYAVGGISSFILNKFITFEKTAWSFIEFLKFAIMVAFSYFFSYFVSKEIMVFLFSHILEQHLLENIALLGGVVLYAIVGFILQKLWVFKK